MDKVWQTSEGKGQPETRGGQILALRAADRIFDRSQAVAEATRDVSRQSGDLRIYSTSSRTSHCVAIAHRVLRALLHGCQPSKLLDARRLHRILLSLHNNSSVLDEALDGVVRWIDELLCMRLPLAGCLGLDINEWHYVV